MPSMRALTFGFFMLAAVSGASCGDETKPPVDASAEHIIPGDLGQSCPDPPAGCYLVSNKLGGACQERCVSLGQWPAICTTKCLTDRDCGPGAPHCTPGLGTESVCMLMTGDPNTGCVRPDANFMPDARPPDAEF